MVRLISVPSIFPVTLGRKWEPLKQRLTFSRLHVCLFQCYFTLIYVFISIFVTRDTYIPLSLKQSRSIPLFFTKKVYTELPTFLQVRFFSFLPYTLYHLSYTLPVPSYEKMSLFGIVTISVTLTSTPLHLNDDLST